MPRPSPTRKHQVSIDNPPARRPIPPHRAARVRPCELSELRYGLLKTQITGPYAAEGGVIPVVVIQ